MSYSGFATGYPTRYATSYQPGVLASQSLAPADTDSGYFTSFFTGYATPYGDSTPTVVIPVTPNDTTIMLDILGRLQSLATTDGTKIFDNVDLVETPDSISPSADWSAYAAVWYTGGGDLDDAMSNDSPDVLHSGTFSIKIQVAALESSYRPTELTRLVSLVKSVINNQFLGGQTVPGRTRLRTEARMQGAQPQGTATLNGEYQVIITGDELFAADFQD